MALRLFLNFKVNAQTLIPRDSITVLTIILVIYNLQVYLKPLYVIHFQIGVSLYIPKTTRS